MGSQEGTPSTKWIVIASEPPASPLAEWDVPPHLLTLRWPCGTSGDPAKSHLHSGGVPHCRVLGKQSAPGTRRVLSRER